MMERCLANPIALRQAILYAAAVARLVDEYVALGAVHELVPLRRWEQVARGVMHVSEGRKADLACERSAVSPADMPPAAEHTYTYIYIYIYIHTHTHTRGHAASGRAWFNHMYIHIHIHT